VSLSFDITLSLNYLSNNILLQYIEVFYINVKLFTIRLSNLNFCTVTKGKKTKFYMSEKFANEQTLTDMSMFAD